jgi:hypothetical protein
VLCPTTCTDSCIFTDSANGSGDVLRRLILFLPWGRRMRAAMCRRHTLIGRRLPIAPNFRPGPKLRSGMPQLGLAGNSRRRPPHPPARGGRAFTAGWFAG